MNLSPQRLYITETLQRAKSPCVLSSFGKDSALLLHLVREQQRDVPVYFFGDELPELAEHLIVESDLTVLSCAPADRSLVPNGEGLAVVDEYVLGNARLPMLSEVVKGDNCQHGLSSARTPNLLFPHDVVLWGYKQNETMDAVGKTFEKEINLGPFTLVAPLYEMTDADVYDALERLEIAYANESDEVEFCDECLNAIISSDWDKQAALAGFRSRYGFQH